MFFFILYIFRSLWDKNLGFSIMVQVSLGGIILVNFSAKKLRGVPPMGIESFWSSEFLVSALFFTSTGLHKRVCTSLGSRSGFWDSFMAEK